MPEKNEKNNEKAERDKRRAEKRKKARVQEEVDRLTKLFEGIPENTMKKASSLIRNAAFMTVTLEDLQVVINKEGVKEFYKNGANQEGYKKSVEAEIYSAMVKNHMSAIKQLTDLMPAPEKPKQPGGTALENIIARKPAGGDG